MLKRMPLGMPYTIVTQKWMYALAVFARLYPIGAVSGLVLVLTVLMAAAAPLIAPYDPLEAHFDAIRQAPSTQYLMGTDNIGRDVLSRIIYGARISLFVAFIAVLLGDTVGGGWGIISAYAGGKFDIISQRILEMLMSFPTLILAMVLTLGIGRGLHGVIIAIAITRVPLAVRVIRGVVLSVKEQPYVLAATSVGASPLRIMVRHIGPQCIPTYLVLATAHLGTVIILEASLSFLGLGIPPPTSSWGNMLGSASGTLTPPWWLVVFPGVAITIAVLAFNLLGDSLRDIWDPKMRGSRE